MDDKLTIEWKLQQERRKSDEQELVDLLEECLRLGNIKVAEKTLQKVKMTFSRYNEYRQRIDNVKMPWKLLGRPKKLN